MLLEQQQKSIHTSLTGDCDFSQRQEKKNETVCQVRTMQGQIRPHDTKMVKMHNSDLIFIAEVRSSEVVLETSTKLFLFPHPLATILPHQIFSRLKQSYSLILFVFYRMSGAKLAGKVAVVTASTEG